MATINLVLLFLSLTIVILAAISIGWARGDANDRSTRIGRWLFTLSLLALGGIAILAALLRSDALAPMGLLSGLLLVGMFWESPEPNLERQK